MGVDAKAILVGAKTPLDIIYYLSNLEAINKVCIVPSGVEPDFVWVRFTWLGEERCMSCFFNGNCQNDYKDVYPLPACFISLGCWGLSDAIIVNLTKHFGGFYMLNDFDGEWTRVDQ